MQFLVLRLGVNLLDFPNTQVPQFSIVNLMVLHSHLKTVLFMIILAQFVFVFLCLETLSSDGTLIFLLKIVNVFKLKIEFLCSCLLYC